MSGNFPYVRLCNIPKGCDMEPRCYWGWQVIIAVILPHILLRKKQWGRFVCCEGATLQESFERIYANKTVRPPCLLPKAGTGVYGQPHLISIADAVGPAALCSGGSVPIRRRREVEPAGFLRGPRSCLWQSAGRPPAEDAGAA